MQEAVVNKIKSKIAHCKFGEVFVRDDFYLFHIFLFKKFLLWMNDVCSLLLSCPEK